MAIWINSETLFKFSACPNIGSKGTYSFTAIMAETALLMPRVFSRCTTCRCRLDISTSSWSTIPNRPIPPAPRYNTAGDPRPPAPTTSTELLRNFNCPIFLPQWGSFLCASQYATHTLTYLLCPSRVRSTVYRIVEFRDCSVDQLYETVMNYSIVLLKRLPH